MKWSASFAITSCADVPSGCSGRVLVLSWNFARRDISQVFSFFRRLCACTELTLTVRQLGTHDLRIISCYGFGGQ
jgi:hypothetical protein